MPPKDLDIINGFLRRIIGDSADTGGSATTGTVMGKGNAILSLLTSGGTKVVKSIQHVTYSVPINTSSGTIRISTVIPSKCVVIFERLEDGTSVSAECSYSLGANEIQIGHGSYSRSSGIRFGFWIVEFY